MLELEAMETAGEAIGSDSVMSYPAVSSGLKLRNLRLVDSNDIKLILLKLIDSCTSLDKM